MNKQVQFPTRYPQEDGLWIPPVSQKPAPLSQLVKKNDTKRVYPIPDQRSPVILSQLCPTFSNQGVILNEREGKYMKLKDVSPLYVETEALGKNSSTCSPRNVGINSAASTDSGIGHTNSCETGSRSCSPLQSQRRSTLYRLKSPNCLTSPYQAMLKPGELVFLYVWTLPKPHILARLSSVDPACFVDSNQCFGLLFSKPLSTNDYVCRLPLYLNRGMARARFRLVRKFCLSTSQLEIIISAHKVLAELLTNVGDLSHVGVRYADRKLRALVESNDKILTTVQNDKIKSSVTVRNLFKEMDFCPTNSPILGLVTFLQSPGYDLDLDAARALMSWSHSRSQWSPRKVASLKTVWRKNGVVPEYGVRLRQIPTDQWPGTLVRPRHLSDNDPGLFAVSNPSRLVGLDPIPTSLLEKIQIASGTASPAAPNTIPHCSCLSYTDYFAIRYPPIRHILTTVDGSIPLASTYRLTRHQNAAQVTAGMRNAKRSASDKFELYLADGCSLHPLSSWMWFLMCTIPLVTYQLMRSLSAVQLHEKLSRELEDSVCGSNKSEGFCGSGPPTVLIPDRVDAPKCMLSDVNHFTQFDLEVDKTTSPEDVHLDTVARVTNVGNICPHPSDLLEATTLLAARDAVNLERLELLGDSLLQLIGTLTVYSNSPSLADEGYLSSRRTSLVSNANLCDIAVRLGWSRYCTSQVYFPPDHFLFPCFTVSSTIGSSEGDTRLFVRIYDKALADMMEALIGCFLQHCGIVSAFKLLSYFGISPDLKRKEVQDVMGILWSQLLRPDLTPDIDFGQKSCVPTQVIKEGSGKQANGINSANKFLSSTVSKKALEPQCDSDRTTDYVGHLSMQLIGLQNIIGYQFENIMYLIRAVTHRSSPYSSVFGTYQRLEFLGDAVLGYVVTINLYNQHTEYDPGKLTESRSNIVSNNSLAGAVVEHKIYPYILHNQPFFDSVVSSVICIQEKASSYSSALELLNQEVLKGLRVKILADVFESILGAVFLDSRGNLKITAELIYRLIGGRIKDYLQLVPTNPLRKMHFLHPDIKYCEMTMDSEETNGKYKLCVSVSGEQIYTYGATRNEARLALAQHLHVPLRSIENDPTQDIPMEVDSV
ncbi:unnamed protein product [Calicophoron daubneyi]|uniref:RNase III domain-containing protein n=1 Tax=Calicophoron daubneyi TaxID=300641 RepID=A0AAV2TZZ9_CALDB